MNTHKHRPTARLRARGCLSLLKTSSNPETLANCAGWQGFCLMIRFRRHVIEAARADHRARRALVWECVALQHQLVVLSRSGTRRPRFRPIDRLFWVFMSWWWPAWRDGLKVIQPETALRWRRHGIALIGNIDLVVAGEVDARGSPSRPANPFSSSVSIARLHLSPFTFCRCTG